MSSSKPDNHTTMSKIIKESARKTVEQTQAAVRLAEEKEPGKDSVTIMLNGAETKLNRSDYEMLKHSNREVQLQMKRQLRDLVRSKNTETGV